MVPALAGHHHVIRVDLPGCGQSPPPLSYDVPVQAARVADLLDGLGLRRVAVAGHSSGGYVATALAEQRPDLVRSLALISSGPSPDALLRQPYLLRVLLAPPLGPLLWSRRSDAMIRAGIRATATRPVDVPDDLIAGVRSIPYRAMRTVLRRNTAYITERSVPERLAALGVPVLVIFGTADRRWEPSSAHQYEAVPNARVELLPGVGHIPILEGPQETSKLLLGFAGDGDRPRRRLCLNEPNPSTVDKQPVQPVEHLGPGPGQLVAAVGLQSQHRQVLVDHELPQAAGAQGHHGYGVRVGGVGLRPCPVSNTRIRAARFAGTSSTVSPPASMPSSFSAQNARPRCRSRRIP
jgi:pimeloyl-ACP methyl ester carboxylesterase